MKYRKMFKDKNRFLKSVNNLVKELQNRDLNLIQHFLKFPNILKMKSMIASSANNAGENSLKSRFQNMLQSANKYSAKKENHLFLQTKDLSTTNTLFCRSKKQWGQRSKQKWLPSKLQNPHPTCGKNRVSFSEQQSSLQSGTSRWRLSSKVVRKQSSKWMTGNHVNFVVENSMSKLLKDTSLFVNSKPRRIRSKETFDLLTILSLNIVKIYLLTR